ncbi:hypothetical protein ACFOU0_09135 [Salinicoccus sesuvii]|uniref:Uncharacterized protein n=1 Tax=Salinicoccus sesuvii TaxID=868281 RepID=A0ABV7N6K2_9STAP
MLKNTYGIALLLVGIIFLISPDILVNANHYAVDGSSEYVGRTIIAVMAIFLIVKGLDTYIDNN